MPLRLYNTLTHSLETFAPGDAGTITFYSCGPTVYDDAHIGNFRSFLAADVLRRWIESPLCEIAGAPSTSSGRRVVHVMNITDVGHMTDDEGADGAGEDKMAVAGRRIAEAKKAGKLPTGADIDPNDPYAIASFYADRFLDDARRLGLKVALEAASDSSLMPRASANIDGMRIVIEHLLARGYAYAAGKPGQRAIYFNVRRFPSYGALSGNTLEALREGAGGRIAESNQSEKAHPADFLLWKEDAAHIMKWPSPRTPNAREAEQLGPGYPGWHIECTVMAARRLLGDQGFHHLLDHPSNQPAIIDLHSGGEDNIFPHHECEIAQSVCAFCDDSSASQSRGGFARHWFHARHLFVEGEKMSKRRGNFYTARQLFEPPHGFEPAALRLELIKTHYRSNANFTMQGLKDSQRIVERWRRFVEAAPTGDAAAGAEAREAARRGFGEAMNEDLNIAGAIGVMNKYVGEIAAPALADIELVRLFDLTLGVLELERPRTAQTSLGVFVGCEADAGVIRLLEARATAKKNKDFARSDAIRQELAGLGYAIKDVPGGKVEVRKG